MPDDSHVINNANNLERYILHHADGTKGWYLHGKLHRDEGPAVEYVDGSKEWFQCGKRHRIDAPAIEWISGTKEWWQHGYLHHTNGPAVEYSDGDKSWYVDGQWCTTIGVWAYRALIYENKELTQRNFDAKIQQVMQQDIFQ